MVLQQLGDCRVGLWYVQHAPTIELIFDVVHLDLLSLIFFPFCPSLLCCFVSNPLHLFINDISDGKIDKTSIVLASSAF